MHEIFLTAVVNNDDVARARAILSGVLVVRERHIFEHIVHYYGPLGITQGLPAIKEIQKKALPPNVKLWNELHQYMGKFPYILIVRNQLNETALKEGTE